MINYNQILVEVTLMKGQFTDHPSVKLQTFNSNQFKRPSHMQNHICLEPFRTSTIYFRTYIAMKYHIKCIKNIRNVLFSKNLYFRIILKHLIQMALLNNVLQC